MALLAVAPLLAATLWAQQLSDAPAPQLPAKPDFERSLRDLRRETFADFAALRKKKLDESLLPKSVPGAPSGPEHRFGFNRNAGDPARRLNCLRFASEDLTIHVLQPAPGIQLGAFYADNDVSYGDRQLSHDARKGGRLTLQLGGKREKRPAFHFPFTATYAETETSCARVRVEKEDFDKGFRELKP